MTRDDILVSASDVINGDRQEAYGDPKDNLERTAMLWSAFMGVPFSGYEVAVCLALVKVSRLASDPLRLDSFIDLAAYAAIAGELATGV